MTSVFIKSESRYPIDRKEIRKKVKEILKQRKIVGEAEVSVIVAGDRKMKSLNKKYRGIERTTPVLAFPLEEFHHQRVRNDKRFPPPFSSPDDVLRLGDIVISYPQAVQLAIEEEKLVDKKINELVEHGMQKLLGSNF